MSDVIIDHLGITVADYARSRAFYTAALGPLGVTVLMEFPTEEGVTICGLGKEKPILWLTPGAQTTPHLHVALTAASRAEVDAFYAAALAAAGRDNGPPGLREHYHPNYYGAFVFDPDGHNIEAVCHRPE